MVMRGGGGGKEGGIGGALGAAVGAIGALLLNLSRRAGWGVGYGPLSVLALARLPAGAAHLTAAPVPIRRLASLPCSLEHHRGR